MYILMREPVQQLNESRIDGGMKKRRWNHAIL